MFSALAARSHLFTTGFSRHRGFALMAVYVTTDAKQPEEFCILDKRC